MGNIDFKIAADGTIVRGDKASNTTKQRNGMGITGFILSLFALIGFIIIGTNIIYYYSKAHFEPSDYYPTAIRFYEYINTYNGVYAFYWIALFFVLSFGTTFSIVGIFRKPRWIAGFVISMTVLISAIVLCVFYYIELAYYTSKYMNTLYYIELDGQQYGAYTLEQVRQFGIFADTLVFTNELDGWKPASEYPELAEYITAGAEPLDIFNLNYCYKENEQLYGPLSLLE